MTYEDILNAVNIWTEDDESARFDLYLRMVEADMDRRLRTVNQMTTAVSVAIDNQSVFGVPLDFLSFRHISIDDRHLEYSTPDQFLNKQLMNLSGNPRYFTLVGAGLSIYPAASVDAQFSVAYYAKVPELSASGGTNWVGDDYPDIYIFGCLEQAFSYHMDDARENKFNQKYNAGILELSEADRRDKWASAPLSMKAVDYVV